jgi:hypothetical protein
MFRLYVMTFNQSFFANLFSPRETMRKPACEGCSEEIRPQDAGTDTRKHRSLWFLLAPISLAMARQD